MRSSGATLRKLQKPGANMGALKTRRDESRRATTKIII